MRIMEDFVTDAFRQINRQKTERDIHIHFLSTNVPIPITLCHSQVSACPISVSICVISASISVFIERLSRESSFLCDYCHHKTLTAREVQTAARLLLPGELSKHAISEGTKAITKYSSSR